MVRTFEITAIAVATAGRTASAAYQNCTGSSLSTTLLPAECAAWQDFYDGTGGKNWHGCADSRLDPCGCQLIGGVACNTDGHLIWVYMDSNNLHGTVPASVSNWPMLSAITLSNNHLAGPLPEMSFDKFYQECDLLDHHSGGTNAFTCPLPKGALEKCNKIDDNGNPVPMTDSDCGGSAPTPAPGTPTPPPTPTPATPTPPPVTPTPPPATPTPPPTAPPTPPPVTPTPPPTPTPATPTPPPPAPPTPPPVTPTPPPATPTPPPTPAPPVPTPTPTPAPGGNPFYCDRNSPTGEYVCRQSVYGTESAAACAKECIPKPPPFVRPALVTEQ